MKKLKFVPLWVYKLIHRMRYPDAWEYQSAATNNAKDWNAFGLAGWEIYHIDQRYKPFCIYMKRRVRR